MDKRVTKDSSQTYSTFHFLFGLLALTASLWIILNLILIMPHNESILGTEASWKSYPSPKFYSTTVQLKEKETSLWTDRLLQCGYLNHSFTPEERSEGTFLMKMIEWPAPPKSAVPFQKSSDPAHVHFVILNSAKTFYVGDQLQVMLQMRDFEGHPKQYGGDYLQARIHTPALKAGSAGTVIDNQNGIYYINFTLSWPGKVEVSVLLVHPCEGIQALKRLREERPERVYFKSTFKSGAVSETTVCNLCLSQSHPLCNFTDIRTGEPWFCYKPKKLPCSARINHAMGGYQQKLLIEEERHFFQSGVNVKRPILPNGLGYVTVQPSPHTGINLGGCVSSKPLLSPAGFYYQDQWMSRNCNVRRFNTPANITNCLRGKKVHIFGDSTIRQWFEYLTEFVPGLKKFDLGNSRKTGPHLALDIDNKIKVEYYAHGSPIRISPISNQDLPFIANKLDEIKGGKNTVIAFTIWCHFNTFPVEPYIRRLQNIRRSILRLLERSPDTLVVIKTANVQALPREVSLYNSDWYSYQLDLVMRKMFEGINVAFVDAWEMTIAHYLPHELHPKRIIIKNEVDVFLSYVCPL
ncbi:NXPE family member 3-like [Hemiscyllium ocellatum]|uniref:NXPE family member 3-like n=1 Tax=Hemiscyllium ocellatum TaxID=170820 RepID=UPI0029662A9A|nr:NXPE family member 3-like [Hemiscyllium ocellatum]XP_060689118.1 NXPE family member 3-like [Hemiscyllium ocellatum]XP_060689119.1 NXPE family member 3-like [Hemiscyllium ocellatum]XP_060689121.1 NXPE family member 3-like [Hemiscyllium ocellatum]XP_060689122.1 NXPE family member 3-like [Hemiscyllium ocellatum]XP_060689123.1 NXPE family member 3-like [Hemiscyllium ocellatum]XP_060689124.1 NXPE family member 3-like [Hemiscyllium ocellatum]XP_060689125.1 NXPE family member 3-like [Hemiscylliu